MSSTKIKVEVHGFTRGELVRFQELLGSEPVVQERNALPQQRMETELLSAAFILGLMNAAPAVIKSISDFLSGIRSKRYFTMKVTLNDGRVVIEGAATPERIAALADSLRDLGTEELRKLEE